VAEHSFAGGQRVTSVTARVLNQTNKHGGEKAMARRRRFLKIYALEFGDIWQSFYFYRILNNENFKIEVKQTNFVTQYNDYSTIISLII